MSLFKILGLPRFAVRLGSVFLDFILGLLKWPVALLALVSLPALYNAFSSIPLNNMRFFAFLAGGLAYLGIKILAAARSNVYMQVLAHELTHIFFAWLTLHKVVHIHLNFDQSGGAMGFKGKGNWLITIGPYFFPLFLFVIMMAMTFFSNRLPDWYLMNGIFGYFFAYHLESVVVQIHGEQTDFKEVGFPFCWLFLPGANLFVCSVILAFNNGGWVYVEKYLQMLCKMDVQLIAQIISYFTK